MLNYVNLPVIHLKKTHQRHQAVNVAILFLSESVHTEDTLYIVCGVPRSVEDDDAVGRRHVQAEAARPRRY